MKMIAPNRFFKSSLTLLFATTLFACTKTPETPTDLTKESFTELLSPGIYLAEHLVSSTGFSFSEVSEIHKTPRKGNIFLVLDSTRADLGMEGYELSINPKLVQITGFK